MAARLVWGVLFSALAVLSPCSSHDYRESRGDVHVAAIAQGTYQIKSIVVADRLHRDATASAVRRMEVARIRLSFAEQLWWERRPVFQPTLLQNPFQGGKVACQLVCGDARFSLGSAQHGLFLTKPSISEDHHANFHLHTFLRSLSFFREPLRTPYTLEAFLVLSQSDHEGGRVQQLLPQEVPTCVVKVTSNGPNTLVDARGMAVTGELPLSPTPFTPLKNPTSRVFVEALSAFEQRVGPREAVGSASVFLEVSNTDAEDELKHVAWGDIERTGMRQFPLFLETNNKLQALLRSGTRSRQVFAVAIDPILNQAPPEIAKMLVKTITEPIIELIYPILGDVLTPLFVPPNTLGSLGGLIENVPRADISQLTVPIQGKATEYLKELASGAVQSDFNVPPPGGALGGAFGGSSFVEAVGSLGNTVPFQEDGYSLLEVEAQERSSTSVAVGGMPSIAFPIKAKLATNIANGILEKDMEEVGDLLDSQLSSSLRVMVNRTVSRTLMQSLTTTLTESLSHACIKMLCNIFSRTLLRKPTKEITNYLTPVLAFSLATTVQRSVMRPAIADYYCYFCLNSEQYCTNCQASRAEGYYKDYYTGHYAHHYSQYFRKHYGRDMGDWFVDNYQKDHPFSKEQALDEPESNMDYTGTKPKPKLIAPHQEWGSRDSQPGEQQR